MMTTEQLTNTMDTVWTEMRKRIKDIKSKSNDENYELVEEYIEQYEKLMKALTDTIGYVTEQDDEIK